MGKGEVMNLAQILYSQYPKENRTSPVLNRVSPTRILGCPRGGFFEAYGFRGNLNPQDEQNFGFGTLAHEKIQRYLTDQGISIATEREIRYDDPPLLGFVDAVVRDEEGLEHILEIKTTKKALDKIQEPMESHYDQIQMYMHVTGIHSGIILYETKDSKRGESVWKEFNIDYNQKRAELVLNRGKRLLKNIQEFKIPIPKKNCFCSNPACFSMKLQKEAKEIWNEDK